MYTSNSIGSIWHLKIEFVGKGANITEEDFGQVCQTKVTHVPNFFAMTVASITFGSPNAESEAQTTIALEMIIRV